MASTVLIFSTVTIRILTNLLKNLRFTLKTPKFPTFYSETFVEKSHYYGGPIERSVTDHHNKSILDEGHGSWFMERMESPYKWCFFQNMISTYTKDSSHKK